MDRGMIGLGALGLGAVLVTAAMAGAPARVYTVPQVLSGLAHDPAAWAGRTVLVRGTALALVPGCPRGQWCPSGLSRPGAPRPGPILLLEPGPADPLVSRVRRLPLLRTVAPEPQRLRRHVPSIYRLRFQVVPHTTCDGLPCVNALLVDAAF